MRFFIEVSYHGKFYHGWQIQPNAITVQEVLEQALSTILQEKIKIVGAGRTDTGVHARQMFAHFNTTSAFTPMDLVYKLNSFLPEGIAVASLFRVPDDAHARFDASSRTYHYIIETKKDVFNYEFSHQLSLPLQLPAMTKACEILKGYNDFECFSKTHTDVKTYLCNITEAHWTKNDSTLCFVISADRFLRNMVRAIVGTMINIGLGKMTAEDLHTIIASKKRSNAGFSAPAKGLFLHNIKYPEALMNYKP